MKHIKVTYIYPIDLLGEKVGGIKSCIIGCIKYSPNNFDIEFIGITTDPKKRPVHQWKTIDVCGKKVNFYPILHEKNENKRTIMPLALRFATAIKFSKLLLDDRVLILDRIEPILAVKKWKCPKIGFIHNDIINQIKNKRSEVLWSRFPQLYFFLENMIFPHFTHLYTVSINSLKLYHERYPSEKQKFTFVPTWVDPDIFSPPANGKYHIKKLLAENNPKLNPDYTWILNVGRIQKSKAPFRLIDSFIEYHKNNSNSILISIGEGNLRQKAQEYAVSHKMHNHIFYLGNMKQRQLADYYRASDVLALVSNYEGMPLCVLECLGSGTPVVTTKVGEVQRIVENGFSGEIIDSFDPIDISYGIDKILANPKQYTAKNTLESIKEFTPQQVLQDIYQRIEKIYTECCGKK